MRRWSCVAGIDHEIMTQTSQRILVRGVGAVSSAGWGTEALVDAVQRRSPIQLTALERPGWSRPLRVRSVPSPAARPSLLAHPRLRRTSPISHYAVSAALEALGDHLAAVQRGEWRLGVVLCAMSGCVTYSRRFFDEALRDPATASPLLFPETVFNAPSSHLAAVLGTTAMNYTLVGDPATYLTGLLLAAEWLEADLVDGCVVVGAEEVDWLTVDAFRLFTRRIVVSEGAGALYLVRESPSASASTEPPAGLSGAAPRPEQRVQLARLTDSHAFRGRAGRTAAARAVAAQLTAQTNTGLLCDGVQGVPGLDGAELEAWRDWPGDRVSIKTVLGEGLMAAAAWQCVMAVETLRRGGYQEALVNVTGCNAQAAGAAFAQQTGAEPGQRSAA
jgi:3-oxoacyl-(acyl-carrier-protein) synthase